MAPLQHQAMLADQGNAPCFNSKRGAFLDANFRPFRRAAEGGEDRHVGAEANGIVAPMPSRDHPAIRSRMRLISIRSKVAIGRRSRGCGNGAMTLKRFSTLGAGCRVALIAAISFRSSAISFSSSKCAVHRIAVLPARRAVGNEAGAVVDRIDRDRLGRDADHGRAGRHVLGDDRIGADLAHPRRPRSVRDLRARADDDAVAMVGWRLPPTPVDGLVPPSVPSGRW